LDQALSGFFFFFFYYYIVPVGYDPKNPVGTGPFKYKSFVPGSESTCVRNENYWQSGLPYLDEVIATDYSDETSQVNAMQGGQADVADLLTYASIHTLQASGHNTLVSPSGTWTPFTMRVDVAPLNDARVRQALRLVVNRPQMRDLVFGNNGLLGNDLFGIWDPSYNHAIPQRHQDIGQAKSLLKSAGHESLQIQLVTADVASGTVQAATVFAQQAAAAGITVNLRQVTVTDFYGKNYLQWAFAQDYWSYAPYLVQVGNATLPSSPYNECHFDDPNYNALYAQAIRTVDDTKRTQIVHEMQEIDYSTGGYIIRTSSRSSTATRRMCTGSCRRRSGSRSPTSASARSGCPERAFRAASNGPSGRWNRRRRRGPSR
jgi:peptide/nickel transport system substrate-binding protein